MGCVVRKSCIDTYAIIADYKCSILHIMNHEFHYVSWIYYYFSQLFYNIARQTKPAILEQTNAPQELAKHPNAAQAGLIPGDWHNVAGALATVHRRVAGMQVSCGAPVFGQWAGQHRSVGQITAGRMVGVLGSVIQNPYRMAF